MVLLAIPEKFHKTTYNTRAIQNFVEKKNTWKLPQEL